MAISKYNYQHQQARRRYLAALQDGDLCHLCNQPMYRAHAQQLHLDHDPNGNGYRGLSHARCNVVDGASRGGIATKAKRLGLTYETYGGYRASRNW